MIPRTRAGRFRLATVVLAIALGTLVLTYVLTLGLGGGRDQVVVGRNPLLDQPAPDFTLMTVDGEQVSLADYRGRPVIINFWATWCEPCREEFPLFREARERYREDGLEILGIIHRDNADAAREFAASHDARWPLLLDPQETAWRAYRGALLPISYYVDRDGIVRAVSYGPPPSGVLDEQIAKIL